MIEQNVQVVRCSDDRMWVRMGSQTGCTACDNGNGCGAGVFAKLLQKKPVIMELARSDANIKPGQMVTLGFPEQVYLKLVFAYYGWPLLAALAGAFAGYRFGIWVQASPAMVDLATLLGGLIAGGLLLRSLRKGNGAGALLNSLQTTVYIPSATANMCSAEVKEFTD
jgi:sigma-E factor negative regulatory protein RseC